MMIQATGNFSGESIIFLQADIVITWSQVVLLGSALFFFFFCMVFIQNPEALDVMEDVSVS